MDTGETKRYPVSETFVSPKGEGLYLGTPMRFLRFAGCSVGKVPFKGLNCKTYDGRAFLCDTDFNRHEWMTIAGAIELAEGHRYVCITGGEPLDHELAPLLRAMRMHLPETKIHLETSGTVPYEHGRHGEFDWIACSPKVGMLDEYWDLANELKFLVDENFNEDELVQLIEKHDPPGIIYVQPINHIRDINNNNTQRALALIQRHPTWRLAVQAHKYLGVR